jgi:hypothetical protein
MKTSGTKTQIWFHAAAHTWLLKTGAKKHTLEKRYPLQQMLVEWSGYLTAQHWN